LPPEGVAFWQAGSYRLPDGSPGDLEAEPGALWRRSSPTTFYKPAGKTRQLEAGPHLDFLRLKGLMEEDEREELDEGLVSFTGKYGLLSLSHQNYTPRRLPDRKLWVAPEAVIQKAGELRKVDPATEGTELLLDLLDEQGYLDAEGSRYGSKRQKREVARSTNVAMPSELSFFSKSFHGPWRGDPTGYDLGTTPIKWERAKDPFGGLLVLTEDTSFRVAVLSTREHTDSWRTALLDFPSGDLLRLENRTLRAALNSRLSGVSPYSPQEGEKMGRGWRCTSLLEAMYLMLSLDLTGGRSIVKCQAKGCPNWFRQGSQSDSKYYPHPDDPAKTSRCALREMKRRSRLRQSEAGRPGT
jgi:hypothetical protein